METIIAHIDNRKTGEALKAVMKALDVQFESKKGKQISRKAKAVKDSPYDPEFVAKIKEGEEDYKAGRYKAIKTADLWK